jgi:hypothetical protein
VSTDPEARVCREASKLPLPACGPVLRHFHLKHYDKWRSKEQWCPPLDNLSKLLVRIRTNQTHLYEKT